MGPNMLNMIMRLVIFLIIYLKIHLLMIRMLIQTLTYRGFTNVENDIEQALRESYEDSLKDLDDCDKISNLCYGSEKESEMDNFILKPTLKNLRKLYFQGLTLKIKKFTIKFVMQYCML